MEEKDLLEKLKESGLSLADVDNVGGRIFECLPCYRGNYGFHSVSGDGFEAILLKGVYKDFVRIVKGGTGISENDWSAVGKTLNDAESTMESPLRMKIALNDGDVQIISAELAEKPECIKNDKRDYMIPRPLTPLEYAAPASKLYDESVTLSYGFTGSLFPQTLSPFAISILEKIPDVLNPLFISCNLKTSSPTAIPVYNRVMTNMTAFEKLLKTSGTGNAIFRASFAPALYMKKQGKPEQINKSYFPVEQEEITEVLDDLKRTVNHISSSSIVEESYMEYPVKLAIAAEYIFVKLSDDLARLMKYYPSISDCLELIFRTRANSIFYKQEALKLPQFLDFPSPVKEVTFGCEKPTDTFDTYFKKLSFFTKMGSKGKIEKIVSDIHKLLDMRDEVYLTACAFLGKSNEILMQLADFGIKKNRLKKLNEIYLFEHGEVRRLAFDSFFSDTKHTIIFRQWIADRYAALVLPHEIYGKDLEECPRISEKMVSNAINLAEFSPFVLFHNTDAEGIVTAKDDLEDYSGNYIAARTLSVPELPRYKNALGFILEEAALFGFVAEYACLNGIPMYSGVRFAPLVLDNVKVKTSKNSISKA